MYQNNFTTPVQPLKPIIAELINDANALIKEVSPNGDYSIDPESGAILGKRQKPTLSGEPVYEHSAIGWIGVGVSGAAVAGEYFKSEVFASHIENVRCLQLYNLEERIANLRDPSQQVTLYENLTVACAVEELFVEALIVVLEERGYVVDTLLMCNHWGAPRGRASNWGQQSNYIPLTTRMTRKQFIARWVPLLKGTDFVHAGSWYQSPMNGNFDLGNPPEALTNTNPQPEE